MHFKVTIRTQSTIYIRYNLQQCGRLCHYIFMSCGLRAYVFPKNTCISNFSIFSNPNNIRQNFKFPQNCSLFRYDVWRMVAVGSVVGIVLEFICLCYRILRNYIIYKCVDWYCGILDSCLVLATQLHMWIYYCALSCCSNN